MNLIQVNIYMLHVWKSLRNRPSLICHSFNNTIEQFILYCPSSARYSESFASSSVSLWTCEFSATQCMCMMVVRTTKCRANSFNIVIDRFILHCPCSPCHSDHLPPILVDLGAYVLSGDYVLWYSTKLELWNTIWKSKLSLEKSWWWKKVESSKMLPWLQTLKTYFTTQVWYYITPHNTYLVRMHPRAPK